MQFRDVGIIHQTMPDNNATSHCQSTCSCNNVCVYLPGSHRISVIIPDARAPCILQEDCNTEASIEPQ